jgi:hypothetical protein
MTDTSGLTKLGKRAAIPASPDQAVPERVAAPARGKHYVVRFTCPEFTSRCPVTGHGSSTAAKRRRIEGWSESELALRTHNSASLYDAFPPPRPVA